MAIIKNMQIYNRTSNIREGLLENQLSLRDEEIDLEQYPDEERSFKWPLSQEEINKSEINKLRKDVNLLQSKINKESKIVPIQNLESSDLFLTQPIYANLEKDEEGNIIISSLDLDTFGYGDTEFEAKKDFCQTVCDLYKELKENKLGKHLKNVWFFMEQIIKEKE